MPHDRATLQEEGATPDTPSQVYLRKDTEKGKGIKTNIGTESETETEIETGIGIETETERGIKTERGMETEEERETGIETESEIVPVVVQEMKDIEIPALRRRRETERQDHVRAAESTTFPKGLKEAGKREKAIETGSLIENGDEMVGLSSLHLSKTLMGLTCLPSSEPSQSPPPQPPPQYLALQDSPQPPPVGQRRTLTSPTRGRRRENGTRQKRWTTEEVVTVDHSRSHHQGITAMSQTTTQTSWRLMFCLWMVKLWTQTTHLWRTHPLLSCLQSHPSPAPKLNLPPRLEDIIQRRNLEH